jgi:uridine kinase
MNTAKILGQQLTTRLKSKQSSPLLVSLCGAADLGKSTLSQQLVEQLHKLDIQTGHLTLDSYLMDRSKRSTLGISGYQPEAYDLTKIQTDVQQCLAGHPINLFPYDHSLGKTVPPAITIQPCNVLIIDGLHSMHEQLKHLIDFSIFMYTSDENLLEIRQQSDLEKRKQTEEFSVLNLETELLSYKINVEPYRREADVTLELIEPWQYQITFTRKM